MARKHDLTGMRFGRLFVEEEGVVPTRTQGLVAAWVCRCDCGNLCTVKTGALRNGNNESCGCLKRDMLVAKGLERRFDVIGKKFGRLFVQEAQHYEKSPGVFDLRYRCACECGNSTFVTASKLMIGQIVSCGCYLREVTVSRSLTHGDTRRGKRNRVYGIWAGIIQRCVNPNVKGYPYYGGRGISICDRWRYGEGGLSGYECFRDDMGARPSLKHSVDRVDNDGNYDPGNCRWATPKQQANNKRPRGSSQAVEARS